MKHLILIGACYLDTILRQGPGSPERQDAKLRASSLEIRRGGNCANSLEVLQQLVDSRDGVCMYLVSPLPSESSPATRRVKASFGELSPVSFEHCLYREAHTEAASSYILRSEQTGSRTLVNYNDLPEMTVDEFEAVVRRFGASDDTWWHFEGRIPNTTLECVRRLRDKLPNAQISVEVEKPGRDGLRELAAEADVVFYSRSWAEHKSTEALQQLTPPVISSVGAGDTFIAGMLYSLVCRSRSWPVSHGLGFAVHLATTKVQREGFQGLGAHVHDWLVGNAS
ncbi:hypothetical protein Trco_001113 [Trichoderma cornu-damae]|uniref:Carbohydrate kinase PfkB domain-containing protein n=1 Tax=Trichoderma cornu-damae TaxID=654480 RepID=A0A9P8TZW9_9HYPO|nr:hypothetical protein Trco_001113 [Trichoderma cornu-damae]